MLRLLIFLVGMLSTRRPEAVSSRPARDHDDPDDDATWFLPRPAGPATAVGAANRGPCRSGRSGCGGDRASRASSSGPRS